MLPEDSLPGCLVWVAEIHVVFRHLEGEVVPRSCSLPLYFSAHVPVQRDDLSVWSWAELHLRH